MLQLVWVSLGRLSFAEMISAVVHKVVAASAFSSGIHTVGSLEQIVVGMISIGIAGYICSSTIRKLDISLPGAAFLIALLDRVMESYLKWGV